MSGTRLTVKDIVVDSADPERLAAFRGELLGREVVARIGPYVWLARGEGPGLDSADPERLAAFRGELLGREVVARIGPYVWLARGEGPGLGIPGRTGPSP
ncbi:hypothetical protein [Actinacidiphila sp. bgisy167]|uniref:hypothetical protein n=1 Tax=Actinacidiphila sp. bgisy167 TaxID=3413797 RepID=UPI003D74CBDD